MINRYLVVPLVVWAIAQFIKFTIAAFRGRVDFRYLYGSGGMPSVHAAVVSSLAMTALLLEGANSAIFGLTVILAAIVMYDSFGVRRSAGEQAIAINQILEDMELDHLDHPRVHLREVLGHTPLQVSVGAVLGLFLGAILNSDKLGPLTTALTLSVGRAMAVLVAAFAVLLIIAGALARWVILRRYRKAVAAAADATRSAAWSLWLLAVLGLLLAFLEYERVTAAVWVIWPAIYVIIAFVVIVTLLVRYRHSVPAAVSSYRAAQAKAKWLEGPNKKRRAKKSRSRR
jgi:acid phosphatase family membrane protein YuiD